MPMKSIYKCILLTCYFYPLGNITFRNNGSDEDTPTTWPGRTITTWWGCRALGNPERLTLTWAQPSQEPRELLQVLTPMSQEASRPGWLPHRPEMRSPLLAPGTLLLEAVALTCILRRSLARPVVVCGSPRFAGLKTTPLCTLHTPGY